MALARRVEAPNFSWGKRVLQNPRKSRLPHNPGFSPGVKNFDFITLSIYETAFSKTQLTSNLLFPVISERTWVTTKQMDSAR
jgi:hypothetical protein